jgi:hypothetical protein
METNTMTNEEALVIMSDTSTWARSTEEVSCPYCGATNRLSDLYSDLNGPEVADAECRECDKPFLARFFVSISVTAERIE